jgi:hypothetical protein
MVRVSRHAVEEAMASTNELHERTAILGALLTRAVGSRSDVIVVGGSAIAIWTHGAYVSGDVDIVGQKRRIAPALEAWGFIPERDGARRYWTRAEFGLAVDIIGRKDYVGLLEGILRIETPYGTVRIAAVEDLILRRLVFWKREGRPELMDQAIMLFVDQRARLDGEYLEVMTRRERVEDAYVEMQRLALAATSRRGAGRRESVRARRGTLLERPRRREHPP